MVFSAVSRVSSFEAKADPVSKKKTKTKQKKAVCSSRHILSKRSAKNRAAKLIYPNRNGTIQYLAVSAHTLGPVHSKGGGGEGYWQ